MQVYILRCAGSRSATAGLGSFLQLPAPGGKAWLPLDWWVILRTQNEAPWGRQIGGHEAESSELAAGQKSLPFSSGVLLGKPPFHFVRVTAELSPTPDTHMYVHPHMYVYI